MFRKTPVAAHELGIPVTRLHSLIRHGKIEPLPEKDTSGDYVWTDADMERAREAVRKALTTDGRCGRGKVAFAHA